MNNLPSERETRYDVCQVCEYVNEDEAPEHCPVRRAEKTEFQEVR